MAVHAFGDDALGTHDAVGLARAVRRREVSADEVIAAAHSRLAKMAMLDAVVGPVSPTPVAGSVSGPFAGVPTLIKDNSDLRGFPTGQGSEIIRARPAGRHGPVAREMVAMGLTVMAKTTLPEFGLSASTEFPTRPPTRNPWNTDYSAGASSGGSAALVAAGAVPIAHGNDGGGSIRIPAACNGLVGLKPSRGRWVLPALEKLLPVGIVSEGVLTRSVRDTAAFWAYADHDGPKSLRPIGTVTGPSARRVRVGVVRQSPAGGPTDRQTVAAVDRAANLLVRMGHEVRDIESIPLDAGFPEDFVEYWAFLAFVLQKSTPRTDGAGERDFDSLTVGLADRFRRNRFRLPAVVRRLRAARADYLSLFGDIDVVLSPVVGHTTPELGVLSPHVPFDEYLARLTGFAAFTPLHNVTGAPAISLPYARTEAGMPIGVMVSAVPGDERTLLELAYEIEEAAPWHRITD